MDGTCSAGMSADTDLPGNRSLAHHVWLEADASDQATNYAAYRVARSDLSLQVCAQVFELHDSAQHHFITMLLWERENGLMSIEQAVAEAVRHHDGIVQSK